MKSFDITNEEDLATIAQEITDLFSHKIILLKGNLGAGKTTLTKALIKALGSRDIVQSPTYSIVNEYQSEKGKIYHFDLYRLASKEEVLDIGIEDYLNSGAYCFIEWPEIYEEEIEAESHEINIFMDKDKRWLKLSI